MEISETLIHAIKYINHENMLSKRSQSRMTTYCMTPFTQNVLNRQIHRGRKVARAGDWGGMEVTPTKCRVSFGGIENVYGCLAWLSW